MRTFASLVLVATVVLASRPSSAAAKPDPVPPPAWVDVVKLDDQALSSARVRSGIELRLLDVQLRFGPAIRERSIRYVERVASADGLDVVSPITLDFDPTFHRTR